MALPAHFGHRPTRSPGGLGKGDTPTYAPLCQPKDVSPARARFWLSIRAGGRRTTRPRACARAPTEATSTGSARTPREERPSDCVIAGSLALMQVSDPAVA